MDDAGQRLKRARERLNLKFREVEEASKLIAKKRNNQEFVILLSRLSDIENEGTVPSLYRLFSLCVIYRLDLSEVLGWYGVPVSEMLADASMIQLEKTHEIGIKQDDATSTYMPISLDPGLDMRKTFFLSEMVQRWGKLPLALFGGVDARDYRYGFIGMEDWSMHPILPPGSLVVVDDGKRKLQASGWNRLAERPIYFFEHRDGFYCRWCSVREGVISLLAHPSSDAPVLNFNVGEIDVVGQVVGVATGLDQEKRRRTRA